MSDTVVTALGNAGMQVEHGSARVIIDPLLSEFPAAVNCRGKDKDAAGGTDLILITHDHWDHFSPQELAATAAVTGAIIVGPRAVVATLRGRVPESALVQLEPGAPGRSEKCAGVKANAAGAVVTAYRTHHGHGHNSYLVELPGLRFFHDGDNERTQILDKAPLMNLDLLMLCPWKGSGWCEFVEAIKPRQWFLIHMTGEELDQQERGEFFPGLCERVPMQPVALRPGEGRRMVDGRIEEWLMVNG